MIKYALSDLIPIGNLFKSQGVKGMLIGDLEESLDDHIDKIDYLFIEDGGQSLPYFVEKIMVNGGSILFKFEEINSPESATRLSNKTLYLDREKLNILGVDLNQTNDDIINLKLYNNETLVGTISEIIELPGHRLIKIKENNMLSIPFVEEWIISLENDRLIMSFDNDILTLNE